MPSNVSLCGGFKTKCHFFSKIMAFVISKVVQKVSYAERYYSKFSVVDIIQCDTSKHKFP